MNIYLSINRIYLFTHSVTVLGALVQGGNKPGIGNHCEYHKKPGANLRTWSKPTIYGGHAERQTECIYIYVCYLNNR